MDTVLEVINKGRVSYCEYVSGKNILHLLTQKGKAFVL